MKLTPHIALVLVIHLVTGCSATKVRETSWVLPWYTSTIRGTGNSAFFPAKDSERYAGLRRFRVISLENRYLRVDVLPEIGGPVGRAVYKPTGTDLFFREGRAKDSIPYWESGVKVSFPWHEHGIRMTDQPASYRVIHEPDGTISIAMWMEFSRFDAPINQVHWGRFGSMLLTQVVRLQPDEATFSVTYRIVNPTPYRQGRRIWNDALFPRNHTATGVVQADAMPPRPCSTEWIYPANRVCGHEWSNYRPYDPAADCRIAAYDSGMSIFSCGMPHGFAGLWYPDVRVNRLRITDPQVAPGAKQYFGEGGDYESREQPSVKGNFVELWGGTDSVFEGVENWIGPGECFEFTHHFALVRGIGKVSFANQHAAVHVGSNEIEFVTFRPKTGLTVRLGGKPIASGIVSDPTSPVRVPAVHAAGRLEIIDGDDVLVDQHFPLSMPVDPAEQDRIRDANSRQIAESLERQGDASCRGKSYRNAAELYPPDSTGRGRVQYRMGQLDGAIATLRAATGRDPSDGEAWHLLGVALLENGDVIGADAALDRARSYAPSGYIRAIREIARGNQASAIRELTALAQANPAHYEGRLLLACVARDPALARKLAADDPADPRAQYVLELVTGKNHALKEMLREPGAKRRLAEFQSIAGGHFVPPPRMRSP